MRKPRKTKVLKHHEFGILVNSPFPGDDWLYVHEKDGFSVYMPRRVALALANFILDHDSVALPPDFQAGFAKIGWTAKELP